MTALLVSLAFGIGCASVLSAVTRTAVAQGDAGVRRRLDALIAESGAAKLTPAAVGWATVMSGVVTVLLTAAVSGSVVVAVAFGAIATTGPVALLRRKALRRRVALRAVWPDVVDDLASGVRAGLSLPDVLSRLGERGHPTIAPAFAAFAVDYRTVGSFGVALDALKVRLADPVADRIVESLRLARDVGGADLGRLLRTLSVFLRDDARLRAELEVRQGWTVNAARLAASAPWITLAFLSTRPEAVAAYDSRAGVVVLATGAAVTVLAYQLMVRLGRLPQDPRVLA